jgi:hypothetical protein
MSRVLQESSSRSRQYEDAEAPVGHRNTRDSLFPAPGCSIWTILHPGAGNKLSRVFLCPTGASASSYCLDLLLLSCKTRDIFACSWGVAIECSSLILLLLVSGEPYSHSPGAGGTRRIREECPIATPQEQEDQGREPYSHSPGAGGTRRIREECPIATPREQEDQEREPYSHSPGAGGTCS